MTVLLHYTKTPSVLGKQLNTIAYYDYACLGLLPAKHSIIGSASVTPPEADL